MTVKCNTGKGCVCPHASEHQTGAHCDEWNFCRIVEKTVRCTDGKEAEK